MLIAAFNSPEDYKKQAQIVCPKDAQPSLVEAEQRAWKDRDELWFAPGRYDLSGGLVSRCTLHGIGDVTFRAVGSWQADQWMVKTVGTDGELMFPKLHGLSFDGQNLAGGLWLDNAARLDVFDVSLFQTLGGIRATKAWCLGLDKIYCYACRTPALETPGMTAGFIKRFYALKSRGTAPVLSIAGGVQIEAVALEGNVILAEEGQPREPLCRFQCMAAGIAGIYTEDNDAPVLIELRDCIATRLTELRLCEWRPPVAPCAIKIVGSRACSLQRVQLWRSSVIEIDSGSLAAGCRVEDVVLM